jgi:dolichyl-phosphate-mannose-protein mannosyltransferase
MGARSEPTTAPPVPPTERREGLTGNGWRTRLLRPVAAPFLASRLVIWLVAVYAVLSLPEALRRTAPGALPRSVSDTGYVTDVWARWDSGNFVLVAQHGYDLPGHTLAAFYPLYPALVGLLGRLLLGNEVLAAVLVSLAAAVVSACLLYELARRRLGDSVALRAVVFLGVFPYALFLQAVYSESLFLALALGALLAAESRRMALAATLAGLSLLTRPTGVMVVAALAVLAWQSSDRRRSLAWLALAPAIFALYPLLLWQQLGRPFAFLHAEREWGRSFSPFGPLGGLWDGGRAAWFGLRQLLTGSAQHPYWTSIDPDRVALMNLENLAYVVAFTALSIVAWRRLGAAYGVYALGCIALALSAPSHTYPYPLLSFPRFALVIFPAFVALAAVARRPWLVAGIAGTGALLLGVNLLRWSAGHFIG